MASFNKHNSVDSHLDCIDARKYMGIDCLTVVNLLDGLGFNLPRYKEQSYNREAASRKGHGYYSLEFTHANWNDLGVTVIDAKDCQSSMKVFVSVIIGANMYPIKEVMVIRHNQFESDKVRAMGKKLGESVAKGLKQVKSELQALKESNLSASEASVRFSNHLATKRVNYPKTAETSCAYTDQSAYDLFCTMLSLNVANVSWLRHMVKYSKKAFELAQS